MGDEPDPYRRHWAPDRLNFGFGIAIDIAAAHSHYWLRAVWRRPYRF
jgi:hypothetical protein